MFCPQCAADYRPEFTRCSDCDVPLLAERIALDTKRTDARSNLTLTFFLFTFALTWGYSALAYLVESRSHLLPLMLLSLLGSFAPSLVALAITAREQGMSGASALLGRLLIWRVELHWYLFAMFYMPVIAVGVGAVSSLIGGILAPVTWSWAAFAWSSLVKVPVVASEEIGWRGFALPRLTERFGLKKASLVLGILWAAWHLPYFVVPVLSTSRISFAFFVLEVIALSFVFAWLYLRTKGSLLLVTLFHSAINATLSTLPTPKLLSSTLALPTDLAPWLGLGLFWLTAMYCVRQMPGETGVFFPSIPGRHNV